MMIRSEEEGRSESRAAEAEIRRSGERQNLNNFVCYDIIEMLEETFDTSNYFE